LWQAKERPASLITPRCLPAVALLLLGLAVAVSTGVALCEGLVRCACCRRTARTFSADSLDGGEGAGRRGPLEERSEATTGTGQSTGSVLTLCQLDWVDGEAAGTSRVGKEPRAVPVVLLAGLVVFCSAWAVHSRYENWEVTREILADQLQHLKNDSEQLSQQTLLLNYTASNLSFAFDQISRCKHNPVMSMVGRFAVNSTKELANVVHNFQDGVKDAPVEVDKAQEKLVRYSAGAVWFPCAPMLIMSIFALIMLAEVFIARFFGSPATARCENKGLAICAIFFVLIIIFVAATCAAILSVLIGSAQICSDIDQNVVDFVNAEVEAAEVGHLFANVSRFYVLGDVYNPLNQFADDIHEYIQNVLDIWREYHESIVKPQSLSCKPLGDLDKDIEGIRDVVLANLRTARGLFSAANTYRYYRETVHGGICNQMPKSLGQYCIQQALVGLILFPLCAMFTHNYLAHHVSKRRFILSEFEFWQGDTTDDGDTEVGAEVTDKS